MQSLNSVIDWESPFLKALYVDWAIGQQKNLSEVMTEISDDNLFIQSIMTCMMSVIGDFSSWLKDLFAASLLDMYGAVSDPFLDELSRLKAPMGVYSIRGNHDYLLHGHLNEAERLSDTRDLLAFEEGLGWTVLRNQNVLLRRGDDALAVAGVENVSANPFFTNTGGDLARAMEGIPEEVFTILMSHDPSHWRSEVLPHSSIPLTLSGHTHGLPFKFAGFDPSHWRLHENGGLYEENGRYLHVSKGLGSAFAFRLGSFPRIDVIILKR